MVVPEEGEMDVVGPEEGKLGVTMSIVHEGLWSLPLYH